MSKVKQAIILWFVRRLPPCDLIIHQISDSFERKLPLSDRIRIKLHLSVCVWCTRYGRQIGFIRDAVRQQIAEADASDSPSNHLSEDAKNRIKRALEGGAE